MIALYSVAGGRLQISELSANGAIDPVVWIDAFDPSQDERDRLSNALEVDLPSYQDMHEIEASSRLFVADGVVYMTTPVLAQADTEEPEV